MQKLILFLYFTLIGAILSAQPQPCGADPMMTSFCDQACVICDIDGFTGVNDLTAQGQGFPQFCTTQFNNMQYIAFIAGTEELVVRVDVETCSGSFVNSLEVGFFESLDCQSFNAISICDTDINSGQSQRFEMDDLTVGQHYFLVIDGSGGSNCSWTFNVLEGSTAVDQLEDTGDIIHFDETCPDMATTFTTAAIEGAAIYDWTVNGILQSERAPQIVLSFPNEGVFEVCVTARNVCDEAAPSCSTIRVRTPETLEVDAIICFQECIEYNGIEFCESGSFTEIVTLDNGCDSIIDIQLEVLPRSISDIDVWICNDDAFFIGDIAYNETGSYSGSILTDEECDSIVNLELLVIECEISGTAEEIPAICNGSATGSLIFTILQGEPPFNFTYTNIADASITGMGQTNIFDNNEINNLPAGIYQIYIEDRFGNDGLILEEVTEPPVLNLNLEPSDFFGFNVSCDNTNGVPGNDGFIMSFPSGGVPPYTFNWSNGQQTQMANMLEARNYRLTITDAVGCTEVENYTLSAPPILISQIDFRDPVCESLSSGEIEITNVFGGTAPYEYALNEDAYGDQTFFEGLLEAVYTINIRDANGCITVIEEELIAPQIPIVSFPEDITLQLGDSTQIFPLLNQFDIQNIEWVMSEDLSCRNCLNPVADPVNDSQFTLTVTSIDDCIGSNTVNFIIDKVRRLYVPNAFSPNGDGINDVLAIFGGPEVQEILSFNVYDRWGNHILNENNFLPNDANFGWNGSFRGKKVPLGIYIWTAEVLYIDGVTEMSSGEVSLIR